MARKPYRGRSKKKAPQSNEMMAQFQKMQQDMASAQESLENEMVSVSAGGGALTIVISGHQRVQSIEIDPELLDADDIEMLQDMLVAGVNQAIEQSQALSAQRMEGITGSMGGLDGLLGGLGMG